MNDLRRIRVWDLPTRLFHWSLAILVVVAVVTGKAGGNLMDWHGRAGLAIVGLVAFRLAWGLLGSTYARFASFFPTPARLVAYLRGEWRQPGHNPLGALSVLALLALVAFQVGSGLVANDDIAFRGPLFELAGKALSDRLTGLHKGSTNLLLALIALHVAAIVWYARVRRQNLVRPMLTGWQETAHGRPATGGGPAALAVALIVAGGAVHAAAGGWLPPPPPPAPPVATPAW